ncbi:vacuolar sorting-associated protein [Perilla frutescens var. frutescens]|nr:vacuolar sorting-associated protein [Perilla frutescens var. frutescens]
MFGWLDCCSSNSDSLCEEFAEELNSFSLPSPLPQWPKGKDFATGKICLGEIEVVKITKFDKVWSCSPSRGKAKGVSFYTPAGVPDGFFSLGHCCQPSNDQLSGCYCLVARCVSVDPPGDDRIHDSFSESLALEKPLSYSLVWSSDSHRDGCGYIWIPNPPEGYEPMGFVVTLEPDEPDIEEVRCVRADLTESCEVSEVVFDNNLLRDQFYVWNTRPCKRGMLCKGVPVGTFFCSREKSWDDKLSISCLKNLDSSLRAMPTLDQIHALIKHYGPTLYFHPDEVYLPSSVSWFFEKGALLYKQGKDKGLAIDSKGSVLPGGGENDKEFWLDLPDADDIGDYVKRGNIENAELYVHVKPASGGTFTDVVMWIFCPFNGPASIKAGLWSYTFDRIGQHVGDWEHFTLRLSNFNGELWGMYFSEHSGGGWSDASDLEFITGNKPIVYASKHGHASFPHEGCYIQGSSKLGIGARNDCAKSKYSVDSSTRYRIVAAEYLGDEVVAEPPWLQYMREWGPTVVYDSTSELEKILNHLPFFIRFSVENLIELFPTELYGEEGPTGPKEKDNWCGDERC